MGFGRSFAYDQVNRGLVPGAIRIGGRIVISRKWVEKLLAGQ
jgi:predicted DNA-binding transcriptional regulator AlpA